MENINIVIYEDNLSTRISLCDLFKEEPGFNLRGDFANCDTVLKDAEELSPHVIIMDIDMPGTNGIEGLKLLRKSFPEIHVIMYTGKDDEDDVLFECLKHGASGYVKKGVHYLQLYEYIKIIQAGGTLYSPSIASKVRDYYISGQPKNANIYSLSEREYEVLNLLCEGLSQKLIANKLKISLDTVAAHLKKVFVKIGVHSAPEAIVKSIHERLVDRDKLKFE